MSNINFTCPHCSRLMQLPAVLEGKQGKCPSCKAEVVITPDNPEPSIVPTANKPRRKVQQEIWKQPVVIGVSLVGLIAVFVLFISLMFSGDAEQHAVKDSHRVPAPIIPTPEPEPEVGFGPEPQPVVVGKPVPEPEPKMSAEEQYSLGYQYYFGEEAVPQDYKEAMKWCRLAADKGNADAMWLIGILYGSGLGVPLDDQEGLKWGIRAAEHGHEYGQVALGDLYRAGAFKDAMKWYRMAAEQGNAEAQYKLGSMYHTGGDGQRGGDGIAQDYPKALKWYRLAAVQGNAEAQFNIGLIFKKGLVVPQDYIEAVKWFRLAADKGNAAAQHGLGIMYLSGRGIPQNYREAYIWLSIAGVGGEKLGTDILEHIKQGIAIAQKQLSPEQLIEAQTRATELFKQIEERQK